MREGGAAAYGKAFSTVPEMPDDGDLSGSVGGYISKKREL